jgi:integrase
MIDRWLVAANIQSGPIFRRIRKSTGDTQKITDERLTPNGIYDIIGRRIEQAGIAKNIHPHSLRHTYATFSLLAGVPIQEVQKSMGHSSIDTTSRYDRAIDQVGRSPGRSISLNWPGSQKQKGKHR